MKKKNRLLKHVEGKTVSQFVSNGPEFQIGNFLLRKLGDGSLWIEKASGESCGEGMQVQPETLEKIYQEYF